MSRYYAIVIRPGDYDITAVAAREKPKDFCNGDEQRLESWIYFEDESEAEQQLAILQAFNELEIGYLGIRTREELFEITSLRDEFRQKLLEVDSRHRMQAKLRGSKNEKFANDEK